MATELLYPKGVADKPGILEYANTAQRMSRSYRLEIERSAQRNILYYLGVQWVKYDTALRTFRPIALSRRTPRPVTNRLASLVNQAVANLLSFKPPTTYSPASDKPEDIAAATVADRINAIIEREADIESLKPLVARWLILTGNVFLINNFDTGPDSDTDFIAAEQCLVCQTVSMPLDIKNAGGACPQCGTVGAFGPATGPDGKPQGIEYPKGRFLTEVENPFTCYFDNSAGRTIYDSPYFLTVRHRNKDWTTRMYGADVAARVTYAQPSEPYSNLYESLAYATTLWSYGYGTPAALAEPRTPVRRLWIRPRPDLAEEGIYATLVGEDVVESGPWPYKDDTNRPMLNVVHVGFDEIPGRILAKSRVDDIIPKQDQRNRFESIIESHSITMANSVWVVPEGVGLSKVTGEQGQILRYGALQGIPAPQRVSGDAVPPYLLNMLDRIDLDMDSIFGLYEVGRGEAPKGVTAYAAIAMLDERAQQGQAAIMRNWANGWITWSKQNLHIWRQYATDDRYLTTGQGQWSIQKFNKSALTGGINITAEIGTFRPQTMVAKKALFEQLIRLAVLTPGDPIQQFEIATAMGASDLLPDHKADMEHASRRIDQLSQGLTPPPPAPWENNALALSVFRRFMLSEQFEALPPPIQARIVAYAAIYFERLQLQAQMMQRQPGSTAPGPGGPDQKGASDDQNLGTEDGQATRESQMESHPEMAGRE